jgi:hypothetical protein
MFAMLLAVVCCRDSIYGYLSRCYEKAQVLRDGAFFAELLDQNIVVAGGSYYVRKTCEDRRYPRGDLRRRWELGKVVKVATRMSSLDISVEVPQLATSTTAPTMEVGSRSSSSSSSSGSGSGSGGSNASSRLDWGQMQMDEAANISFLVSVSPLHPMSDSQRRDSTMVS